MAFFLPRLRTGMMTVSSSSLPAAGASRGAAGLSSSDSPPTSSSARCLQGGQVMVWHDRDSSQTGGPRHISTTQCPAPSQLKFWRQCLLGTAPVLVWPLQGTCERCSSCPSVATPHAKVPKTTQSASICTCGLLHDPDNSSGIGAASACPQCKGCADLSAYATAVSLSCSAFVWKEHIEAILGIAHQLPSPFFCATLCRHGQVAASVLHTPDDK